MLVTLRALNLYRSHSSNQEDTFHVIVNSGPYAAVETEMVDIPGTQLKVSRVALGTWAMGGWMWGGTDQRESVATIHAALEQGITLIDTAPVYGFGVSEEIVGAALEGIRSRAVIATKTGLEWRDGKVYRNATRAGS
jgi:aryl-alcohol dehydrogenase-like predicted oxidoreductase